MVKPVANQREQGISTMGCFLVMGSALVSALMTALLLLINGSLVMAVMPFFIQSGPPWLASPGLSQFVLFAAPVLLVIGQWMMMDYLRTRLARR